MPLAALRCTAGRRAVRACRSTPRNRAEQVGKLAEYEAAETSVATKTFKVIAQFRPRGGLPGPEGLRQSLRSLIGASRVGWCVFVWVQVL